MRLLFRYLTFRALGEELDVRKLLFGLTQRLEPRILIENNDSDSDQSDNVVLVVLLQEAMQGFAVHVGAGLGTERQQHVASVSNTLLLRVGHHAIILCGVILSASRYSVL